MSEQKDSLRWRIVIGTLSVLLVICLLLSLALPLLQRHFGIELPPGLQSVLKWLPFN